MKTDQGAGRNGNWVSHPATPKMKTDRGVGRNANWVSHPATPKLAPIQPRTSPPELPCNGESAIASMWSCCDVIFCLFWFTRTSASQKNIVLILLTALSHSTSWYFWASRVSMILISHDLDNFAQSASFALLVANRFTNVQIFVKSHCVSNPTTYSSVYFWYRWKRFVVF